MRMNKVVLMMAVVALAFVAPIPSHAGNLNKYFHGNNGHKGGHHGHHRGGNSGGGNNGGTTGGGGTNSGSGSGNSAPIDGGLSILLVAGLALGAKSVYDFNKKGKALAAVEA